jgi:hypothetical protein
MHWYPSTLTPYDTNGDFTQKFLQYRFRDRNYNPLAQIANTYNDYNLKKINGNDWLQGFQRFYNFKFHVLILQTASRNRLPNKFCIDNPSDKVFDVLIVLLSKRY